MSSRVFHFEEQNSYLYTIDNFISKEDADRLFLEGDKLDLIHHPPNRMGTAWRDVGFYSKTVPYYQFAGQKARTMGCPKFIEDLMEVLNKSFESILKDLGFKLNATLVNRYTSGEDHIDKHGDTEAQLKQQLIVAISVFKDPEGTRKFRIRRKDGEKIDGANFKDIQTKNGQLL